MSSTITHLFFGQRMVNADIISQKQCDDVVKTQKRTKSQAKHLRFGQIAIDKGFCSTDAIEAMPGFLGQKMIDAGLLTPAQQVALIKWQERLRAKGFNVPYGTLSISEGLCRPEDIDNLMKTAA